MVEGPVIIITLQPRAAKVTRPRCSQHILSVTVDTRLHTTLFHICSVLLIKTQSELRNKYAGAVGDLSDCYY